MTTIHSEKYSDRSISAGSEADGVIPLTVPRRPKRKTTVIRVLLWTLLGFAILALILTLGLYFGLRTRNAAHTPVKTPGNTVAGIDTYINGPVIETNFADPCLFELDGTFHAFATNRYVKPRPGQINIQYAISKNFDDWNLTDVDALPNAGPWASGDHVWAPDVVQLDDGSFVMYYSARHATEKRHHCVGAATSKKIQGPYKPLAKPLACPIDIGGAIDPDGFKDADGTRYILYKVDGNSLHNATDGRTDAHGNHPTPIMLQAVDSKDGVTLRGAPIQLLDRGPEDGPLIEAPSMARIIRPGDKKPVYVLFFSSNIFTGKWYDVRYATSTTGIKGPYTKSPNQLLKTGDQGSLFGPGGLDVGIDGMKVVFHSGFGGTSIARAMWTGQISLKDLTVVI